MSVRLLCAAAAMIWASAAAADTIPPAKGQVEDPANLGFKQRDLPNDLFHSPLDAVKFYIPNFPESGEGRPQLTVRMIKDPLRNYTFILTITAEGYLDDSVSAGQWRLGLDKGVSGWAVNMAGERWKCYRGKRAGTWTTKPCR